jgi:hypothetical protein
MKYGRWLQSSFPRYFGNVLVSEDDSLKSVRSQANSVGRLRDN